MESLVANEETPEHEETVCWPSAQCYRELVHMVSTWMPEIRVNSEGDYAFSLRFVVAAILLTLFLTVLGPFVAPIAIGLVALRITEWNCLRALSQIFMVGLTAFPLYLLWTMTAVAFRMDTLQEFRKAENSVLELCGPFLCLLILSLVFLAEVCHYCIEESTGRMLLDELSEIQEQDSFSGRMLDTHNLHDFGSKLQEVLNYLHRYIRKKPARIFGDESPGILTSRFMKVMLRMIIMNSPEDSPQAESQELRGMLQDASGISKQFSPLRLLILVTFSLIPALFPAICRFISGNDAFMLSDHTNVWRCRRAYLFMAFCTTMMLISTCHDLIESLDKIQLSTLATMYLAAPRKRRAVLVAIYKARFDKLVLHAEGAKESVPLVEAESELLQREDAPSPDDVTAPALLSRGFGHLRFVLSRPSWLTSGSPRASEDPGSPEPRSSASLGLRGNRPVPILQRNLAENVNDRVSYLATRRFSALQLLARADCLVMESKSQVVLLVLAFIMIMCAVILACSVGLLHGQHAITPLFCMVFLPLVLIVMLDIMNKLVDLENYFYEDTLKILQSWRERMERLRYAVTIDEAISEERTHVDSFFTSLIDPVAALIDYTKNWQKRVRIFGLDASSSRRNRLLLSFVAYFALVLWQYWRQAEWFAELEAEFLDIVYNHRITLS
ncbi:unnamed protein product [Symbiodinium sp. CCMP2592]|nr:unnamed protein product [Symbiodinium sp. CCMP2592]